MAKGQKRSNREVRKPKQEKGAGASKPEKLLGSQSVAAANTNAPRGKGKP